MRHKNTSLTDPKHLERLHGPYRQQAAGTNVVYRLTDKNTTWHAQTCSVVIVLLRNAGYGLCYGPWRMMPPAAVWVYKGCILLGVPVKTVERHRNSSTLLIVLWVVQR